MKRTKVITTLKKLFDEKVVEKIELKEIKEKDRKGYMERANVLSLIPKTTQFKEIMNNFDVECGELPSVDYKLEKFEEAKEEISCLYSMEYLTKILDLCKDYEKVKFKMKRNYPLWVETEDFICVLAPRIESEDV